MRGPEFGVVLMNTGTPDSPDVEHIRPYLKEFLSDRNLIRVPKPIWDIILNFFVLPRRPQITTERYKKIWTPEGSPFMITSQRQAKRLRWELVERGYDVPVELGMRYGSVSVEKAVESLREQGCQRIIVLPLFPQATDSTTVTCEEKVREVAAKFPDLRIDGIYGYPCHEDYIKALTRSIRDNWEFRPGSKLMFSFHSVPLQDVEKRGSTYPNQCHACAELVAAALGLSPDDWFLCFQSKYEDSRKWVGPGPTKKLKQWAKEGVSRVALVAPSFATDCLETLYDCNMVQRELFERACVAAGYEPDFTYIPALNERQDHVMMMTELILEKVKEPTPTLLAPVQPLL